MSETYEYIEGYDHDNSYVDGLIFNVDPKTKIISKLKDQTLIAGEAMSQYIAFNIPRYFDGIDLSGKNIEVLYISPDNFSDVNTVINAERNDDTLAFGWVVPGEALTSPGTLAFSIQFSGEKYKLKTRTIELEIYDGMKSTDILPEPLEQEWYVKLQEEFEDLKKRGADYKKRLAVVISEKGVETASNDMWEVVIENAEKISTGVLAVFFKEPLVYAGISDIYGECTIIEEEKES